MIVGFCYLSAYNPFETFKRTAKLTYFISEKYVGKGLGSICLKRLEDEAVDMGIHDLIAEISSENNGSINFHKKYGFEVVGELKNVGFKRNRSFGVVYMQKYIEKPMLSGESEYN